VADLLNAAGHHVVIGGRNAGRLRQLADQGFETYEVDALHPESIEACIRQVRDHHGAVSGVANCIGSILLKPTHATSDDELTSVLQTNLYSSFAAIRGAARAMRSTGGSVVLVSTAAARIGIPNHGAIAAAKAGVEGLARSAAATYASAGMRVNVVAPGLVKSQMSRSIWGNETAAAASADMHALGRLGEPRDVASMIAWLLAPENNWITGQVIGIDGGLGALIQRPRRAITK
jgi:NAD(P)-dependent dehydrogenase (short-subunit alcohol dehydrogenase family)